MTKAIEPEFCQPIPLAEWVSMSNPADDDVDPDDEDAILPPCHPCAIPMMTHEYIAILKKGGEKKEAAALRKLVKPGEPDPILIAAELDRIKDRVPTQIGQALRDLDCEVQRDLASADEDTEE